MNIRLTALALFFHVIKLSAVLTILFLLSLFFITTTGWVDNFNGPMGEHFLRNNVHFHVIRFESTEKYIKLISRNTPGVSGWHQQNDVLRSK